MKNTLPAKEVVEFINKKLYPRRGRRVPTPKSMVTQLAKFYKDNNIPLWVKDTRGNGHLHSPEWLLGVDFLKSSMCLKVFGDCTFASLKVTIKEVK